MIELRLNLIQLILLKTIAYKRKSVTSLMLLIDKVDSHQKDAEHGLFLDFFLMENSL